MTFLDLQIGYFKYLSFFFTHVYCLLISASKIKVNKIWLQNLKPLPSLYRDSLNIKSFNRKNLPYIPPLYKLICPTRLLATRHCTCDCTDVYWDTVVCTTDIFCRYEMSVNMNGDVLPTFSSSRSTHENAPSFSSVPLWFYISIAQ